MPTNEEIIAQGMEEIGHLKGLGTKLVVRGEEFGIEEAITNHRLDLVAAFDEAVRFNEYKADEDSIFLVVNLFDLGLQSNLVMPEQTNTAYISRAIHNNPKSFIRISKLLRKIYQIVLDLENNL